MLKIQVYSSMILLSIFVFSMLSSCSRSDINSSYSLFSYFALLTHRQHNSLKPTIIILVIVSILVIASDLWAFSLLPYEQISKANRILGYVWIVIEIGLKVALIVMLGVWSYHSSKELDESRRGDFDNSLVSK